METETLKVRRKGDVNKASLKYPVKECDNCRLDLTNKVTPNFEFGKDIDGNDIVTGFCPICGRGYPMIETKPEVTEEALKIAEPVKEETPDDGLEALTYNELQAKAKSAGIPANMSKSDLIKYLREV